jgi:site-specific DNA recombinase
VGKPPYGYVAERIKHPVPARRAEGRHKTKLTPDPARGPVVARIFEMRVHEGLSYRAIAGRLNDDLTTNPPPEPVDPARALGRWSPAAIRDILINPKYTGYMVWNRRATKDKQHPGKGNPRDEWVMSSRPEHPALVPVDLFLAAQPTARRREQARADRDPMAPNPHRQTKSAYRLRSYVYCAPCGLRMHGKRNHAGTAYSYCQPRDRAVPDGHPPTVWANESRLIEAVTHFFNSYVLGPDRRDLVTAFLPAAAHQAVRAHRDQEQRLQRQLEDLGGKADNLLRALETNTDPDGQIFARIGRRMTELDQEMATVSGQLAEHRANAPAAPTDNVSLLDHLPLMVTSPAPVRASATASSGRKTSVCAIAARTPLSHRPYGSSLVSSEVITPLARRAANQAGRPAASRGWRKWELTWT